MPEPVGLEGKSPEDVVDYLIDLWVEACNTALEVIPGDTTFPVDAKEVMIITAGLNAKVVLHFPKLLDDSVRFEILRLDIQAMVRAAYYLGVERGKTEAYNTDPAVSGQAPEEQR